MHHNLKRPLLTACLLLTALAAAPAAAIDPANLNLITFENRTGGAIRYLFLSPGDSDYWGTDILGSTRTLGDEEDLGFYIHYPEACNEFDILAVGEDEAFLVYGFDICDGKEAEVRLTRRDLDDEAPEFTFTTITLQNATDEEIWYLFFSPGDSEMWGVDQLDESTILEPGDTLSVLLPVGKEAVRYDVQAVDGNADSYSFYVEIEPGVDEYQFPIESGDRDGAAGEDAAGEDADREGAAGEDADGPPIAGPGRPAAPAAGAVG